MKYDIGKHGVFSLGETRISGELKGFDARYVTVLIDGESYVTYLETDARWEFIPDAPKARLGMIIHVGGDSYYVRRRNGWWLINGHHYDSLPPIADAVFADHIAKTVFEGVADL